MRAISRKGSKRTALIAAVVLGSAALTGCYEYGYNSLSVYSGDNYRHGYNNPSYGNPYWGWRGNYYYPGVGNHVYDHDRRPHRWRDDDRRYWEARRNDWRGDRSERGEWRDFGDRGGDRGRDRDWDRRGDDRDRRR